jgi:hypothetical protein
MNNQTIIASDPNCHSKSLWIKYFGDFGLEIPNCTKQFLSSENNIIVTINASEQKQLVLIANRDRDFNENDVIQVSGYDQRDIKFYQSMTFHTHANCLPGHDKLILMCVSTSRSITLPAGNYIVYQYPDTRL